MPERSNTTQFQDGLLSEDPHNLTLALVRHFVAGEESAFDVDDIVDVLPASGIETAAYVIFLAVRDRNYDGPVLNAKVMKALIGVSKSLPGMWATPREGWLSDEAYICVAGSDIAWAQECLYYSVPERLLGRVAAVAPVEIFGMLVPSVESSVFVAFLDIAETRGVRFELEDSRRLFSPEFGLNESQTRRLLGMTPKRFWAEFIYDVDMRGGIGGRLVEDDVDLALQMVGECEDPLHVWGSFAHSDTAGLGSFDVRKRMIDRVPLQAWSTLLFGTGLVDSGLGSARALEAVASPDPELADYALGRLVEIDGSPWRGLGLLESNPALCLDDVCRVLSLLGE